MATAHELATFGDGAIPDTASEARPDRPRDQTLERAALVLILLLAAGLRLTRLDQNGYGNTYYSAAARSMLASFANFFFGAFDPVGLVTVDKPPVALWIQATSARILGYGGFSLLLPQALMGVGSVWVMYLLVRRTFGAAAASLAALVMAITPIGVAMDRDNLPDPALMFVLLLGAWALTRAIETGRLLPLMVATALIGLGFEIKMLAAFVVAPTFYLVYFLGSPAAWKTKLVQLAVATVALAAVALAWPLAVELIPKDRRPYIGGSRTNSALELALGYNGLARVMGMGSLGGLGMGPPGPLTAADPAADPTQSTPPGKNAEPKPKPSVPEDDEDELPPFPPPGGGPGGPPGFGPGGPRGMPGFGGPAGISRFANPSMAGLITWLFPLAIVGTAVAAWRAPRRLPISGGQAAILLWTGWFTTHWVVFSFAQGIFHDYYTYIMAPATAAMAGIGAVALWNESRAGGRRGISLPLALVLTAAWQGFVLSRYPSWSRFILPAVAGGVGVAVVGLIIERRLTARWARIPWDQAALTLGLMAILIAPGVWSLTPVLAKGNSMLPTAGPGLMGGPGGGGMPMMPPFDLDSARSKKLIAFLKANHHGERIMMAARESMEISSIISETGLPLVSLGGFMGADQVVTKDEFATMVEEGRVRFVMIGGGPGGAGPPGMRGRRGGPGGFGPPGFGPPGGGPPGAGNRELMDWVRKNGKRVDAKLWKSEEPKPPTHENAGGEPAGSLGPGQPGGPGGFGRFGFGRMGVLYDCNPKLGLIGVDAQ